jgi:hypothetical protein
MKVGNQSKPSPRNPGGLTAAAPSKPAGSSAVCGIAHSKTLAGLTERQRAELLNRVRYGGHTK